MREQMKLNKASFLITIGDSFFDLSDDLQRFLEATATPTAKFVSDDNTHPASEGSQVLANLVWPSLQGLL
jgi:lysophospholipase L1-like esterase